MQPSHSMAQAYPFESQILNHLLNWVGSSVFLFEGNESTYEPDTFAIKKKPKNMAKFFL